MTFTSAERNSSNSLSNQHKSREIGLERLKIEHKLSIFSICLKKIFKYIPQDYPDSHFRKESSIRKPTH